MAESQGLDPRHDPIYQRGYDPAVHGGESRTDAAPSRRSRARRSADDELFAPPGPASIWDRPRADAGGPTDQRLERDGAAGPAPLIRTPDWSSFSGSGDAGTGTGPGADPDAPIDGAIVGGPVVVGGAGTQASPADPGGARETASGASPVPAPWRNPYLVGLFVGGAVLALVGFQMFRAALETIYVDFADSGMIFGTGGSSEDASDPVAELVSMQVGWSLGPLLFLLGIAAMLAVLVFVAVRWRPGVSASVQAPVPSTAESDDDLPGRP